MSERTRYILFCQYLLKYRGSSLCSSIDDDDGDEESSRLRIRIGLLVIVVVSELESHVPDWVTWFYGRGRRG